MVSLATAGRRFDSLMQTTDGLPFRGTIEPLAEREPQPYDFSEPRLLLRVQHNCPVRTGMTIIDPAGRRLLLADHDVSFQYDEFEYRTHRLFLMNREVEWKREAVVIDALTGLKKSTNEPTDLGKIWCMMERMEREYLDATLRLREETFRVVTGADIKLNDIIDGKVVKRIDINRGIKIAEVQ